MEVLICDTYEDLSKAAFKVMKDVLDAKPDAVLGLATGSSPVGLYQEMVRDHKENGTSYKDVKSYNLDEYVGLDRNDPQSYWTFMNENLFSGIDIDPANTHVPYGDTAEDAKAYDDEVKGVDIQLLGIGNNGHIGFNEPGVAFELGTHCVDLLESTIEANKRFFEKKEDVPKQAYTMGIKTIMQARKVLLVASGAAKAEAIKAACFGPVTPQVPGSILQMHPDCTLVGDAEALSLI